MCCIYGVCKASNLTTITFNNIITKYADNNKHVKNYQNIYVAVVMNTMSGEKKDIISFYNDVFIKTMKEHIICSKPYEGAGSRTPVPSYLSTPGIGKPIIRALCPPSPLRSNLPPTIMNYN